MAKIKLLNITEYARQRGLSRTTVWRMVRRGEVDYYTISGKKRKWLRLKKPNFKEMEREVLEQMLNYEIT